MTKRQKREQAIRRNPKQVRFDDLHTVLTSEGFRYSISGSHYTYEHRAYADLRPTIVKPHGGLGHILPIYVQQALTALDEARQRDAQAMKDGQP